MHSQLGQQEMQENSPRSAKISFSDHESSDSSETVASSQKLNDWEASAAEWIAHMGDRGDFIRSAVLDSLLHERISRSNFRLALDIGCGEGWALKYFKEKGTT